MERPCCRSHAVSKQIKAHEDELNSAMSQKSYEALDLALSKCIGVDIAVKLRRQAEVMHLKLGQELKIKNFLRERHHHDNYKDIRKDVERINNMI
jgi:hypothetical protein